MGLGAKFRELYFDRVYAPVYDATVGRLAPYRRLQGVCVEKLCLREGDRVLSVGVGTGNEVERLLIEETAVGVSLVGVDLSQPSLVRARRKTTRSRQAVHVARMDAHHLGLRNATFDRVLSIHTMDFLADQVQASREVLRVLKPGGEFVITYPTGRGGRGLGVEVGKSVIRGMRQGRVKGPLGETLGALGAGLAYLPLALSLRSERGFHTQETLERTLRGLGITEYTIDEEPAYQDFVVWGRKAAQ